LLEVLYNAERQVTTLYVVKEGRVCGAYTKAQVHDQFNRQIVSALITEFGKERVNVQQ
jgi:hypothetical protein